MKKIIILFMSFFLVGCQNYKELNNSAIVNALGIDVKNNEYIVTIQIVNTKKDSDEQNNLQTPIVYSGNGKTINEALNNINSKSPKMLYLGHLELVILSEELAKNGVDKTMDYFIRNNDISKNFTILVSKDSTPLEVLSVSTPLVNFPSGNILGSIEISSNISGVSNNIKFIKFLKDLNNPGIEPVMSSIKIVENDDKEKDLQISSLAIFSNDKLIGYLNDDDTKGYNFITNNINNTNITLDCKKDDYASITINDVNTNIKSKIKNNKPIININISASMEITENNCDYDITKLKKLTKNKIKETIIDSINKIKTDYQSDIFGFGNILYKNNNSYFKTVKKNWNSKYFLELNPTIDINLNFNNNFNLLND